MSDVAYHAGTTPLDAHLASRPIAMPHTLLHNHYTNADVAHSSPSIIAFVLVYGAMFVYLGSLVLSPARRTLYDQLTELIVKHEGLSA